MEPKDLPPNSMILRMDILSDGDLKIYSAYHFGDELTDEECLYYESLLNGLNYTLNMGPELCSSIGAMATDLGQFESEEEFVFEPDEELIKAVSDTKVVLFNKKKLH